MRKSGVLLLVLLALGANVSAVQAAPYVTHFSEPFRGPQGYFDQPSGAIYYVESDGKHLAKIERNGRPVWVREPHADAQVEFYRTPDPKIVGVGPLTPWMLKAVQFPKHRYVAIRYSNSQFGVVDVETGRFEFLGQD